MGTSLLPDCLFDLDERDAPATTRAPWPGRLDRGAVLSERFGLLGFDRGDIGGLEIIDESDASTITNNCSFIRVLATFPPWDVCA